MSRRQTVLAVLAFAASLALASTAFAGAITPVKVLGGAADQFRPSSNGTHLTWSQWHRRAQRVFVRALASPTQRRSTHRAPRGCSDRSCKGPTRSCTSNSPGGGRTSTDRRRDRHAHEARWRDQHPAVGMVAGRIGRPCALPEGCVQRSRQLHEDAAGARRQSGRFRAQADLGLQRAEDAHRARIRRHRPRRVDPVRLRDVHRVPLRRRDPFEDRVAASERQGQYAPSSTRRRARCTTCGRACMRTGRFRSVGHPWPISRPPSPSPSCLGASTRTG